MPLPLKLSLSNLGSIEISISSNIKPNNLTKNTTMSLEVIYVTRHGVRNFPSHLLLPSFVSYQ